MRTEREEEEERPHLGSEHSAVAIASSNKGHIPLVQESSVRGQHLLIHTLETQLTVNPPTPTPHPGVRGGEKVCMCGEACVYIGV